MPSVTMPTLDEIMECRRERDAAYERIDELLLALVTARARLVKLAGDHESGDEIQKSVLRVIDGVCHE